MEKKITSTAIKGLIISLILIVFSLVIHFMGLDQNKGIGAIQFIILIGGVIWSCISYAKEMNTNVTFGNVFSHGFKVSAAVAAIMVLFTIIMVKFIAPEMIDAGLAQARENLEANGKMSDEQIEQGLSMTKKFFVPFAAGAIMLYYLIVGVIASLIGAAVAKKNPQGPFQQTV